jgi:type IV fimbrial biogenesis protein FimT
MKMLKKESGFSLLELMIVLAMIAILAGVGIPGFISYRNNAKIQGAGVNIQSDLQLGKIRAIKENAFVVMLFTTNGYTMFVDNGAAAGNWVREGDERMLAERTMPAGVFIDLGETTLASNRIRFDGRGLPRDLAGDETIVVEDVRGQQRRIVVNLVGRITVSS